MALVFDFDSKLFVVTPQLISLDSETARLLPAMLARRYLLLPLQEDGRRLALAMLNPLDAVALNDVRIITGLNPVPLRLDVLGGAVPSWQDLECPRQALAWKAPPSPLTATALTRLLDLAYPEPVGDPPGVDHPDDAPVVRVVDLILSQAALESLRHVWVLPQSKCLLVLARNQADWREWMTPSKLIHSEILTRLKRVAGLDPACRTSQQATFETNHQRFVLATHQGEHGEEAFLTLLARNPTDAGLVE